MNLSSSPKDREIFQIGTPPASLSVWRPCAHLLESIDSWACSSVGRAPRSQRGGRGFEPPHVHQTQAIIFRTRVLRRAVGRASRPGREGRGFEPPHVHQPSKVPATHQSAPVSPVGAAELSPARKRWECVRSSRERRLALTQEGRCDTPIAIPFRISLLPYLRSPLTDLSICAIVDCFCCPPETRLGAQFLKYA